MAVVPESAAIVNALRSGLVPPYPPDFNDDRTRFPNKGEESWPDATCPRYVP